MKRIALDLDGCLYNFQKTACFLLNHYKGYKLDWKQWDTWNWIEAQVSKKDWQWLWGPGVTYGLFRYGNLITGSIEGIRELSKLGAVVVVTSRPAHARQDTIDWLSFMRFPVSGVHIIGGTGVSKSEIIPKFDLAIDDSPTEIESYIKAAVPLVVYRHTYNDAACAGLPEEYQAYNWVELVEKATRILK